MSPTDAPTIPALPPVGMQRRTRPTEQIGRLSCEALDRVLMEAVASDRTGHDRGDEDGTR
jgi:hypothetical protein